MSTIERGFTAIERTINNSLFRPSPASLSGNNCTPIFAKTCALPFTTMVVKSFIWGSINFIISIMCCFLPANSNLPIHSAIKLSLLPLMIGALINCVNGIVGPVLGLADVVILRTIPIGPTIKCPSSV